MLQCQIISHFCSKCCLVLCPFRVQSLGKYTSLPWWYVRGCWSQKRAVYNCVFVDFFNVNKPSNGAFKIEPFVRRLRGVRELSWDQMKCCSSEKVNHCSEKFFLQTVCYELHGGFSYRHQFIRIIRFALDLQILKPPKLRTWLDELELVTHKGT